jgi:AcrR family transcriptional regulator
MVAADHSPLRIVAEEDTSKRRQILDGARKVFMDLGFDGASMGEIARSAGVSKGTLYVYFADKNRLFEAIVEETALEQGEIAFFDFDASDDAVTMLRKFGAAYIGMLLRPEGGSAIRTVMAIAERMPEVGRRYYERVLQKTINRLADHLLVHEEGDELMIDDRELAASQFLLTCQASLFLPFIFQAAPPPPPARVTEVIDSAVRMFVAAYGKK